MKLNYAKTLIINYAYILILELIFKIGVIGNFDGNVIYHLVFSLVVANILTLITHLFKNRLINKILYCFLSLVIFLIYGAELVYYSFYKTICGFEALLYGGQVMEFYSAIVSHISANFLILGGTFVPLLIIWYLVFSHKISFSNNYKKDAVYLLIGSCIFCFTFIKLDINASAYDLVYKKNDLMETTNNLGVIPAITLDGIKILLGFEETIEVGEFKEVLKEEKVEYNVTNIDFQSLINTEKDATLKSMHTYFGSSEPTNKNEYTGLFAGKNLIFIVAEGFYPIAVDEKLTPTLYKLTNSGFIFDNFYQPIFNCSTSDGEFISQLSILPGVATCSMKETINTTLPYSVGNILKNQGYTANAFHGWTYNYYARDKVMPNLGYTYYGYDRYKRGYKYALKGIKDSWPTSDIDVINASYDIYSKNSPFVTYYMSISGHLEYNFTGGNAMATKNKKYVQELKAKDSIKAYIATQIEFDKSLELLLENLKRDGLLEDTVIVITPDHYPYGLKTEDIKGYVDWVQDENFDLYKNNLIIYNSDIEPTHVSKYTSSLDLLPTLLNLFGVEYDSRLLIGKDIFSNSDDLVIFNNKSWITSKGRYNYLMKKFEPFTSEEISDDYIAKINKEVDLKFQMSKLLISKNYYQKIGGQ